MTSTNSNSASKKTFAPGQSGNPKGRPKGSLNKATLLAQQLLAGEAESITRKVIELAMAGDRIALKLCLERLVPPLKGAPLGFSLPEAQRSGSPQAAYESLFASLSQGLLSLEDAEAISRLLQARGQAVEIESLSTQIAQIREALR